MTFIPSVTGVISTNNSSTTPLVGGGIFQGQPDNIIGYSAVEVLLTTDVDTAPVGISFQFSADGINWTQARDEFSLLIKSNGKTFSEKVATKGKFFRFVLTNGEVAQSSLSLQTRLCVSSTLSQSPSGSCDALGRWRVANPYTHIDLSNIGGSHSMDLYNAVTGTGSITDDVASSTVSLQAVGSGAASAVLQSRRKGIYQPGKGLLAYVSGVLNAGLNAATVATRIGYFDTANGYYFQFKNGLVSIVKRSSSDGGEDPIETSVAQTSWNVNQLLGSQLQPVLDPTKALIFWFAMEGLGIGFVDCGVLIDGVYITCHRFVHSNVSTLPDITQASLPIRWEVESTAGAGKMTAISGSVVSEGGYCELGRMFSVNRGTSGRATKNVLRPFMAIRLRDGSNSNLTAFITAANTISSTGANFYVELWRFVDTVDTTILGGPAPTWTAANTDSNVEFTINSTTFSPASGTGFRIQSMYGSNNSDLVEIVADKTAFLTCNGAGLSDIIVIAGSSVAGTKETFFSAITWREVI